MHDWMDDFRSMFPALGRWTWLDTPTVAPAAQPVLDAVAAALHEWREGSFSWQSWEHHAEEARRLFSELINVSASSVTLLGSLAEAASTVAHSLPPGRVVVGAAEFRSNLFPWLALRARPGYEVIEVLPGQGGFVPTEAILRQITTGTTLVAVTEVQSSNGFRVHLDAVAERCREVGARLFVNATQSAGVLRLDAATLGADFIAAHGYKWLLAPRGAAWMAVRPDRVPEVAPLAPNWRSVEHPYEEYYGGPFELAPGAAKLDGSLAWFSWVGAAAALRLVRMLPPSLTESRALELARHFRYEVGSVGFTPLAEERPSHIVALRFRDPDTVRRELHKQGIAVSVRSEYLRLGFHAFNNETDVDSAVKALRDAR